MHKKTIFGWEIVGFFFLVFMGFLLHFAFEWSNRSLIIGLISPVNESVWEHLKLGFWSVILFSLLEYWFVKDTTKNFFFAKGLGILALQGFVLLVFYTYTLFTDEPILAIDISSYIVGCILCQIISYSILTRTKGNKTLNRLGLLMIFIHAGLLIAFTFIPPKLPIFQDPHSLSYGIDTELRN